MSMGKKSSFICSHVDSFTPEKGAIHTASPSHSYRKCKSVPPSEVAAKPINCQRPIDRFIKPPVNFFVSFNIVYSKRTESMFAGIVFQNLLIAREKNDIMKKTEE